jgi:hypothetical protein
LPYHLQPDKTRAQIERHCAVVFFCDHSTAERDDNGRWHVIGGDETASEATTFVDRLNAEAKP